MDLSSLIAKLLENLASEEVVDFNRGMEGMGEQLENVENILSSIRTVLDDAEKKQLDDDLVKEWCMQVQDAVCDLDDVIDEINTNALKRKLVGKSGFSYDKKPLESQIQNILAKLEYIGERKDMLRLKEVVDKKRPQGSDPAPSRKNSEPDEFSKISYRTTTSEKISLLSNQKQLLLAKGSSVQPPPVIRSKSQKSLSPSSFSSFSSFSNIHEQYDWPLRDEGIGAIDLTTRNEQLPKSNGEENLDESVKLQDSLDLSENRQGDIPRYISVLSSFRNLTQVLPFSEPNKLELLTVQSTGEDKQMPLEPTDELIIDGKLFGISFPCKRIPNWSTYGSSKSSISVTLSPHDNYSSMEGMALFVVFEIKADENFDKGSELNAISCYFQVDECLLENPIVFENFKNFGVGSFGICCYIPQQWFAGKLTKASTTIEASISKERQDVELKMCGIHPIYGLDIEEFSKNLAQTANEHRVVVWDLNRHCNELLDCRTKLESFGDMISIEYDRCEELTTSTEPPQEAEQNESDSTTERRRDIQSLLSRLFQDESNELKERMEHWNLPAERDKNLGDVAICYLPPNLYNDESWVGLELYVLFKRRPTVACNNTPDSDQTTSLLLVDLYAHGDTTLPILTYPLLIDDAFFGSHSVFFHIPRECFPEQLNQCKGISTLFRPSTPDLEVEVCGTRLLYKQDSESLIQVILDSAQGREEAFDLLSEQVQMYLKAETSQRDEVEQEGPHFGFFSSFEREQIEWLQKHLTSTEQASEEVRTLLHKYIFCVAHNQDYKDFDPILLHSRHWFLDNQCQIQETIGKGSSRGLVSSFNHLHIMAETLVALGSNLVYWKEDLQLLLKELFKKSVLVSLSFKGHIISVLKNFDVCSTYNFCFPRKEILDWFELRNSTSTLRIELNDKSWSGLAICAAFFIHPYNKHQIISSDMPLKILCHLTTSGKYCLNPVPVFSITKEKLKWLDHGLVWLTYIPHKLLIELNGESSVVVRIYSEAPYLKVKTCGVRLLYDQDVDQFKETIIQCWASFFDNLDSMSQFVAYEDDEKLSGSSNEVTK
ncbi:hypothetical protein TorRG33x02_339970 [Trema orientale]|uniref:Disease resistance N-terminal domain-containing protein n=1 Tax=Trema orientale TaxID=63057 RepID=A0A2P5AVP3_TREOI|nr:hypothetical protein TorRG33x02_339970 [Trema orientale]